MNNLSDKGREIVALLLFGLTLFALLSTLSFEDSHSYQAQASNLCGQSGHKLAKYMLYNFGYACYALYICIAIWGVILFLRKEVLNMISKGLGLMFFTLFFAALLSHFLKGSPPDLPDQGGLVGLYINNFFSMELGLGVAGARIILILLVMITFLLATDWLFYSSLVALSGWISKYQGGKTTGKKKKRSPSKAKKKDKAAAAALVDEEEEEEEEGDEEYEYEYVEEGEEEGEDLAEPVDDAAEEEMLEEELPSEAVKKHQKAVDNLLQKITEENDDLIAAEEEAAAAAAQELADGPVIKEAAAPDEMVTHEYSDGDPIDYEPPPMEKNIPYEFPPLDLLEKPEPVSQKDLQKMISKTSSQLENTLRSFKIEAEVVEIQKGPVITMFEMELAPGIKVERIRSLDDDIAMSVKAQRVRIVAPIPGKSTFGVEVPNTIREMVCLRELLSSRDFNAGNFALPICLGKDAAGRHLIDDLAKMPHLLVAGATGSGKSVCLNSIIMSILYTRTPQQTKLILIDPKMVELSLFKKIPHLMCPVVTDMKKANSILEWAVNQMEERYNLLSQTGVRNIYGYNKLTEEEQRSRLGDFLDEEKYTPILPFIVIVVDELADLMMVGAKDVEGLITRLAQKSRAVGIHLILATQRPSTNVITGLIKANMPTRIAFSVASKIDSRVILDANGAEKLLGQGDMLYIPPRSSIMLRAQGAFLSDEEIRRVTNFLKDVSQPVFEEDLVRKKRDNGFDPSSIDDLYDEAAAFIIETQRGSASLLQRRFSIGYTRASRLIDIMGQDGILGEHKGSQAREVLLTLEDWEERMKSKGKAVR